MNSKPFAASVFVLIAAMIASSRLFAAGIGDIHVHGAFETVGVIVHLSDAIDGDESATLEYRVLGASTYREAHEFVSYDGENMASSIFNLEPSTTYEIRVTLSDPDGVQGPAAETAQVTTRAQSDSFTPNAIVTVAPSGAMFSSIQAALDAAQPGDEIRVAAGVYGPVSVSNLNASSGSPIVVRAEDSGNRPIIDGSGLGVALDINQSSYLVFDGLEIRNGGPNNSGVGARLSASSRITIRNSLVHDNGRYEIYITQSAQFSGGTLAGGYHLIENNELADLSYGSCSGGVNSPCANQTYFGIRLDNNAGAGTVIRNNTIYDHVDNIAACGDEGPARSMPESVANVLALTGGSGNQGWTNHNLDIYDNVMYDARDDDIEADGICVNARIYRNAFGAAQNPISVAPAMPGPYFFVRNTVEGTGEASAKFNTAAGPTSSITVPAIRNIFFYHNTFARANQGTVLNLWYAVANDHNVPVKNVVFRNNVFWATAGGRLIDASNNGTEHPSFDFNLWFTTTTGNIFEWWTGSQTVSAQTFSEFQSISGQEANGVFQTPGLDGNLRPVAGGGSAVVDRGVVLPGINDDFSGSAPDLGAFELASGGGGSPGTLQFAQTEYSATEGDGFINLVVSRASGSTGAVSVDYAISGGTATQTDDFTLAAGTLNWTNGDQADKVIRVDIVDDSTDESQETVEIALSNAAGGATLGSPASTTLRIDDNDTAGGGSGGGSGSGNTANDGGGGAFDWYLLALLALIAGSRTVPRPRRGR